MKHFAVEMNVGRWYPSYLAAQGLEFHFFLRDITGHQLKIETLINCFCIELKGKMFQQTLCIYRITRNHPKYCVSYLKGLIIGNVSRFKAHKVLCYMLQSRGRMCPSAFIILVWSIFANLLLLMQFNLGKVTMQCHILLDLQLYLRCCLNNQYFPDTLTVQVSSVWFIAPIWSWAQSSNFVSLFPTWFVS